jgi:hypothetical protein
MTEFEFGSCGKETNDKIIVCEERGRRFIGQNDKGKPILKVEVDGCLEFNGKKCDWLLIDINGNIAYFIELKGSDIKHALLQLGNTIKIISNPINNDYIKKEFKKKNAYIIIRHCPLNSPAIQKETKKFKKEYKTDLSVRERFKQKL